jgi:hypothetical protein
MKIIFKFKVLFIPIFFEALMCGQLLKSKKDEFRVDNIIIGIGNLPNQPSGHKLPYHNERLS